MPHLRPNPLDVLLKGAARLRSRGPAEVAGLVARRVHDSISSNEGLVVLVRDTSGDAPAHESLTFRRASPADAPSYARAIGTDSLVTFRRRLRSSARCYLALAQGLIVHSTWCTTGPAWTRELGAFLVPPAGDAYVYESYTRAEARGKGAYPYMLRAIAAELHGEGVARLWVGVEADNIPSLRAVEKAGFAPTVEIGYRRRWGRVRIAPPAPHDEAQLHIWRPSGKSAGGGVRERP